MRTPLQFTLPEIQQSFRDVWAALDTFLTGNRDLDGRKFTNVGDAAGQQEWITLGQGDRRYEPLKPAETSRPKQTGIKPVRIGLYADRGPAWAFRYTIFEASDRNYVAWASDGANWIYAYGIHSRTQSQLSALAATLGTNDVGYLVWVTDFGHLLRWTGSAWEFGPGEIGGRYIQGFVGTPGGPGTYWQICDGTASSFLNADGTTTNFTTPNLTVHYLKFKNTGYTASPGKAGTTDNEAGHTHTVDPPLSTTGTPSATTVVASGTGATVASDVHTHNLDIAPFTSGAGSAHNHGPGTLDLDRTELIPYFRR